MDEPPESLASQRALYALGLGLLAFVTSASPVGILAIALPAGATAIAMGIAEARTAPKRSKSRRLAGAGIAFTLLGLALAAAWVYASFAFASAFGGSPRLDVGRLMCTACQVVANRNDPEPPATSESPPEPARGARRGASMCTFSNVVPVWPESDVDGICAGTEQPTLIGPWRLEPETTAQHFAATVLGWTGAAVARMTPSGDQSSEVEIEQEKDQRVHIEVQELLPGTWSVVGVSPAPAGGGLRLRVTGSTVSVEATPAPTPGASSTEVKTIGYRGSQASASSTGGRVTLAVPSAPGGGRAPGWLLILTRDASGRILTAEAVALPAGSRDHRIG